MIKTKTETVTVEKSSHLRSKSNNANLNNKCRHEICTCYKPSHKCPIDYNKEGTTPPTNYQQEFVQHKGQTVQQYRPVDNLKNGKAFFDGTNYQREFKTHQTETELATNRQINNNLNQTLKAENYTQDHISFGVNLPHKLNGTYTERNLAENYEKPAKFMHQKVEQLEKKPLQKESEYLDKFKPMKRDYSGNLKINYDNLHVYSGPSGPVNTTYQQEHIIREGTKRTNDHLFELNKKNNDLTYAQFLPKDNYGNGTEYNRTYEGKVNTIQGCPINDLPSLKDDEKRLAKHLFYDSKQAKWKTEKV